MSDETAEGRYPDAIGSLVGASREVARLIRERDGWTEDRCGRCGEDISVQLSDAEAAP